jgi:hypothetical protein
VQTVVAECTTWAVVIIAHDMRTSVTTSWWPEILPAGPRRASQSTAPYTNAVSLSGR